MSTTTHYGFDKQKWGHQIREDDLNRIAANLDLIDEAIYNSPQATTFIVAASDSLYKERANYKCTGIDDQVEIQKAIDALPSSGRGKIAFLGPKFSISDTMWLKECVLEGMGVQGTVFELAPGVDKDMFGFHENANRYFPVLKHMYLKGNGTTTKAAINTVNPDHSYDLRDGLLENVMVMYGFTKGIVLDTGWGWGLNHVIVEYCSSDAFTINSDGGKIINSKFMSNDGIGVKLTGARAVFTNSDVFDNGLTGVYINNRDVKIGNCNIMGNARLDAGAYGIFLSSKHCLIDNNYFHGGAYKEGAAQEQKAISCTGCYNIVRGNVFSDGWTMQAIRLSSTSHDNKITDNYLPTYVTGPISDAGINNIYYTYYSDIFMDVLAASANYTVNAQNLVNGAAVLTGAQPKYSRGLDCTITEVGGSVSAYTMTVVGIDAKGKTITEVFTFADDGLTFSSDYAFDHVTSITLTNVADAGNATFVMGIDKRLGLQNKIYETTDVWKIIKNGTKQTVAGAQVDINHVIYDMSVIDLAATDDFTISFKSSLNIIA